MEHITTPFGRRALSLGMAAAQVAAREVEGKVAHKWKTFRAITECREALGVSDRDLVVLNALLTCLPETALTAGDLVVFPSNKSLSQRSHGMAETTLRRHVAALVRSGLVIRRDSPNGKRYAHRGEHGIERAYGFDLSPILARAGEFDHLASEAAARRRGAAMARERVTLYRRDIAKMIEAGVAVAGAGGAWGAYQEAFAALCHRLPRNVTVDSLVPLTSALQALAIEVSHTLEGLVSNQESSGNDGQNGAHIENSKPETNIEIEPVFQQDKGGRSEKDVPLAVVLKACPDITMYDTGGIQTWRDLIAAASLVRGMLGISASAWQDARAAMGETGAAITIAGILQRADTIRSPGGYLRNLTDQSRAGEFSAWPMLMALMRGSGSDRPPSARSMAAGGRGS